jgi:signal transduction histidine kinase
MSRALWLRFFAISLAFALALSALFLYLRRELAGAASNEVQNSIYLFLAHIAEEKPYEESIKRIARYRAESPAMPFDLWIVSASGEVLASTTDRAPPAIFERLPKPVQVHQVMSRGRFFAGAAAVAMVKLDEPEPTYLLVRNARLPGQHVFFEIGILFVAILIGAMFIGLSLVTLYLRGRSRQVRQVIGRIEAGDLGARFQADKLDAVGGLMLDFNRMADEIQRLVARLQAAERTRRDLLQELGHDLRTPLTSMKTGIETLAAHGHAMSPQERQEFLSVVTNELDYFRKLIDDLFFIAEIDEPRYRKQAERIDLAELIAAEIDNRQAAAAGKDALRFEMQGEFDAVGRYVTVGDRHLIARLFRNVFDNTARHARSRVAASLAMDEGFICACIEDDGPGMTPEAIAGFGRRRAQRLVAGGDLSASLGLGSVIIKTIVELHGGRFSLESGADGSGTRMKIYLPRDR